MVTVTSKIVTPTIPVSWGYINKMLCWDNKVIFSVYGTPTEIISDGKKNFLDLVTVRPNIFPPLDFFSLQEDFFLTVRKKILCQLLW